MNLECSMNCYNFVFQLAIFQVTIHIHEKVHTRMYRLENNWTEQNVMFGSIQFTNLNINEGETLNFVLCMHTRVI